MMGAVVTLVTVTVPFAFVITRIGATMRAVEAERAVDVDDAVVVDAAVVDVDGVVVVVVAACARAASGGLTARVGVGVTDEVSVGVRSVVLAPVATEVVPIGPAAN
jgi:hypothetical protein